MTDVAAQIVFPPQHAWIPNTEQITDSARTLLAVAGGVLDYYGRGEDYTRRALQHGDTPQVLVGAPQILVGCVGVFPGRAGEEQFQFAKGALGKLAERFARYVVTVARPWPKPKGGMTASLPDADAIDDAATTIDTDALIVYSALVGLSMGGVQAPATPLSQNQILVASMVPTGPGGGMADWRITVEIQF